MALGRCSPPGCEPPGTSGPELDPLDETNPNLGLEIGVRLSSEITEMWVRGEIDMLTLPQLSAELSGRLRDGARELVLDLRDVTFLSAGGVSLLLAAADQAQKWGIRMRVLPSRPVCQVTRLLGLTERLNLTGPTARG